VLVHAEISQMNESFADILDFSSVLVSSESSQSFLEHVNTQGIVTSNYDINSQVIFEIVYQVWICDILRYQRVFFIFYFCIFCNHFYASPASLISRLHYP
jgi:hypothetical protein